MGHGSELGWRFSQPFGEIAKASKTISKKRRQKSYPKTRKSLGFQQKSRLLRFVDDMWTKCGQSVVEVWSLKVWESAEQIDLWGSGEARGPHPLGALGPGPLGAPRASSDPRKSAFSALSQTFNDHTSTTL